MRDILSGFYISYNNILKIILLSVFSEIILFILSKLMGNKEMSQLSMFDYIIGITIGSIAAEMATSLDDNFMEPLIAMSIYALFALLISILSYKSMKFRRLIYGNSLILLDNGELYKKNFKTAKLDINEFLEQCRTNGYFNLNDIQTAILESNGKISFLPKSNKTPLTPEDMNLTTTNSSVFINIIIDGHVLQENLEHSGHDLLWLNNELGKKNISDVSEVFLAMCDTNNQLIVYKQNSLCNSHDYFD